MIVHKIEVTKVKPAPPASPCAGAPIVVLTPERVAPENASIFVKMRRLRREVTTWIAKGAKFVPREVRLQRLAICRACEYFNAKGNLGLGECKHPGCGCSKVKAALATSVCPHKPAKWPPFPPPAL